MAFQLTILIVEDYEDHRNEITSKIIKVARKEGHLKPKILLASNLDEAIKHVKTSPIDAIILDYELKENPQDIHSPKKYGDVLIDRLTNYSHRKIYILLRSQFVNEQFYELRKKVNNLGFGFDFCGKIKESSFELDTKYNSIVNWVKQKPLPYPIAHLLHTVDAARNSEKFFVMLNFIEVCVRYFTSILVADLAYNHVGTIDKKINFGSYTFGGWLNALKILINMEIKKDKDLFLPELKNILSEDILDSFDYFLELRNDNAHNFTTNDPVIRERLADTIKPTFNRFKNTLFSLYRYPLLVVQSTQIDEDKHRKWQKYNKDSKHEYIQWYKYDTNSLMSSTIPANSVSFSSQFELLNDRVYLSNWKSEFLSLHPFISFSYPPSEITMANRAFFLIDGIKKDNEELVYRSIQPNTKFSSSKDFKDLQELLNTINSKTK